MDNIDLNEWLAIGAAVVGLITALVHTFSKWREAKKAKMDFDLAELKKTYDAGRKVWHTVLDALADDEPEEDAINKGVQNVVHIRNHKLAKTSDLKLRAFFRAGLRNGSLQVDEPPGGAL